MKADVICLRRARVHWGARTFLTAALMALVLTVPNAPAWAQGPRQPTTTALTSDDNLCACGQELHLTATVTPAGATGMVDFFLEFPLPDGTLLGSAPLDVNGNATLSVTGLTHVAGEIFPLHATYRGDAAYDPSTSPDYAQESGYVFPSIVLTSSPNPSTCCVTFTAQVTPVPYVSYPATPYGSQGRVTFWEGPPDQPGTFIGSATVDASGMATLVNPPLTSGVHTILAFFEINGCYLNGDASIDQTVVACPSPVAIEDASFHPTKLNLRSSANWVDVEIRPAPPQVASDIDVASLSLNGVPATTDPAPKLADHNRTLTAKFSRPALVATLSVLDPAGEDVLVLNGRIGDGCFETTFLIDVKTPWPLVFSPHLGQQVVAGAQTDVTWDVDPLAVAVSLLSSTDDGVTWMIAASDIANNGTYQWTVPNTPSSQARVAIVTVYDVDETGPVNESEYAVSEAFSIVSPLDVGPSGTPDFALRAQNPSSQGLRVNFTLATEEAAKLSVFDIGGRKVATQSVGGRRGQQSITLRGLPAGLYVVQLSQSGRSLTNRVAVVH